MRPDLKQVAGGGGQSCTSKQHPCLDSGNPDGWQNESATHRTAEALREAHVPEGLWGGVEVGNYTIGKFTHIGVNSPPSQLTFVCVCACMCVHVCGLNCLGNTRAFLLSGQQASFLFYFPACDPWPLSPIPCPHRHNTEASKSPPSPVTLQRTWVMGLILLGASCPHT